MIKFLATAFLASLLLSAPANALMSEYSINVNGVTRTYYLDLPNNYSKHNNYPIVMMLHGGNGDGRKIAYQTNLSAYTKTTGVIAVYPNALPSDTGSQWNDGRTETYSAEQDDVTFLSNLVDHLVARYGHDANRVFLGGSSSGGLMTIRMMCDRTQKFHGYTAAIANQPADLTCVPNGKANAEFFTSTTDPLMPFNGGEITSFGGVGAGGTVLSSADTIAFWAINNGCLSFPYFPQVYYWTPTVLDGTSIIYSNYGSCALDYYQVVGGGHAWPGGVSDGKFGITTQNLNGTQTMLTFFKRFGL